MKADLSKGFSLPSKPKRTELKPVQEARFTAAKSESKLRRAELGERVAVYLPPKLAEELRIRCAKERRSLSDAVTDAVELWASRAVGT